MLPKILTNMCEKSRAEADFVDLVATACIEKYTKLPKTGKPTESEWTVLSCIAKYDINLPANTIEVVSLGTGSKCVGSSKMSPHGDILNDSHAEVVARRGFLVYLYEQIQNCVNGLPSVFVMNNGKAKLKEFTRFIFFSSQLPCGDAAILPKMDFDSVGDTMDQIPSIKRNKQDERVTKVTKTKEETDIHRTGAKCLADGIQDPHELGCSYHVLGQVRTKPGRGDRTLSVSCSDKIARWIHVGIQGALLDQILESPVHVSKFIFGGGVPYSETSMRRATLERSNIEIERFEPTLDQSSICFPHVRSDVSTKPASGSIIWIKTLNPILEVAVLGKKLGVTKKSQDLPSSQLQICKQSLYRNFIKTMKLMNPHEGEVINCETPYNKMKRKSERYYKQWSFVKDFFFRIWTVKEDIWNFSISDS